MPWSPSDARKFTKKVAGNRDFSTQWSDIANQKLASGEDEGTAIKIANGVIKKRSKSSSTPKVSKAPTKGQTL